MDWADFRYFNEGCEVDKTLNWLPHWQQSGCAYFITFRLLDALPQKLLEQWRRDRDRWLLDHAKPWTLDVEREFHSRFTAAIQWRLDEGHGSCVFRNGEHRQVMEEALTFHEGRKCRHISWVIMPNHVHTLTVLLGVEPIGSLLQSWKRQGSRQMNHRTGQRGSLWQKDYHDRLIRDPGHLMNSVRYIRDNPQKARLQPHEYTLWESAFAKCIR